MSIYNEDCITGSMKYILPESIDLLIADPPFGIHESTFGKHYKRDDSKVLQGYVEAPQNYYSFSVQWITQACRCLKPNGSMYLISGWSKLRDILNAVEKTGLETINHLIWKFNFGVATKTKYVSSHYHILYLKKSGGKPKFNSYCRYGSQERDENGGSLNYRDLEDVFYIKKEYQPKEVKNKNKLPDALIEKLILYSSDEGDIVCDFFLGNFTTAIVAKKLGRIPMGFELNKESFDYWMPKLEMTERIELKKVENIVPINQGKIISVEERIAICDEFQKLEGTKKDRIAFLCDKYGRGRFAILNIVDDNKKTLP